MGRHIWDLNQPSSQLISTHFGKPLEFRVTFSIVVGGHAARKYDIGAIPIAENDRLIGMVRT